MIRRQTEFKLEQGKLPVLLHARFTAMLMDPANPLQPKPLPYDNINRVYMTMSDFASHDQAVVDPATGKCLLNCVFESLDKKKGWSGLGVPKSKGPDIMCEATDQSKHLYDHVEIHCYRDNIFMASFNVSLESLYSKALKVNTPTPGDNTLVFQDNCSNCVVTMDILPLHTLPGQNPELRNPKVNSAFYKDCIDHLQSQRSAGLVHESLMARKDEFNALIDLNCKVFSAYINEIAYQRPNCGMEIFKQLQSYLPSSGETICYTQLDAMMKRSYEDFPSQSLEGAEAMRKKLLRNPGLRNRIMEKVKGYPDWIAAYSYMAAMNVKGILAEDLEESLKPLHTKETEYIFGYSTPSANTKINLNRNNYETTLSHSNRIKYEAALSHLAHLQQQSMTFTTVSEQFDFYRGDDAPSGDKQTMVSERLGPPTMNPSLNAAHRPSDTEKVCNLKSEPYAESLDKFDLSKVTVGDDCDGKEANEQMIYHKQISAGAKFRQMLVDIEHLSGKKYSQARNDILKQYFASKKLEFNSASEKEAVFKLSMLASHFLDSKELRSGDILITACAASAEQINDAAQQNQPIQFGGHALNFMSVHRKSDLDCDQWDMVDGMIGEGTAFSTVTESTRGNQKIRVRAKLNANDKEPKELNATFAEYMQFISSLIGKSLNIPGMSVKSRMEQILVPAENLDPNNAFERFYHTTVVWGPHVVLSQELDANGKPKALPGGFKWEKGCPSLHMHQRRLQCIKFFPLALSHPKMQEMLAAIPPEQRKQQFGALEKITQEELDNFQIERLDRTFNVTNPHIMEQLTKNWAPVRLHQRTDIQIEGTSTAVGAKVGPEHKDFYHAFVTNSFESCPSNEVREAVFKAKKMIVSSMNQDMAKNGIDVRASVTQMLDGVLTTVRAHPDAIPKLFESKQKGSSENMMQRLSAMRLKE